MVAAAQGPASLGDTSTRRGGPPATSRRRAATTGSAGSASTSGSAATTSSARTGCVTARASRCTHRRADRKTDDHRQDRLPAVELPLRTAEDLDVPDVATTTSTISPSGVWRILKRLDMNRLPASQRYKRHQRPLEALREASPGPPVPGRLEVHRALRRCPQEALPVHGDRRLHPTRPAPRDRRSRTSAQVSCDCRCGHGRRQER